MGRKIIWICLALACAAAAETVDRIAIIVNRRAVKDSDIDLDLRVTAFLNQQAVAKSAAARKESAQRLVDQALIREELDHGDYEAAPIAESQNLLSDLKKSRFSNDLAFRSALKSHGISEDDLKEKLFFQMTVLRFIDLRFKPGVLVSDDDIERYYNDHRQQFRGSLEDSRDAIENTIEGERVNQQLFDWLARRRKTAKIVYREEELQ